MEKSAIEAILNQRVAMEASGSATSEEIILNRQNNVIQSCFFGHLRYIGFIAPIEVA